jgi:hypothetical protein
MDMDQKKLEKKLREKIEANYRSYIQQLQTKPASDLIEQAGEIAAAKLVYEELMDGCSPEYTEYLLRFENPLEVVRDQWLNEQNVSHDEEMSHVLWNIVDKADAEQIYELDEAFRPPEQEVRLC